MKNIEDSVTTWIGRLKEGDPRSQQEIWDRYFQQLVMLARDKLCGYRLRDFDEEDVALSAFNSFFRAVAEKRIPKLEDRLDLWKVLIVITARKVSSHRKRVKALKRGAGNVRGDSIFISVEGDAGEGFMQVLGNEPTPEFVVQTTETYQVLMDLLPEEMLRQIAQMKLEGMTHREIADHFDCVERTIHRKLKRIQSIWADSGLF